MTGLLIAGAAPVFEFDAIDSTNAEVRRRAEAGDLGPAWFSTRLQTAGRGRRGRRWAAGPLDLQASLLLSLDRPVHEAALISFVTALAAADFAAEVVGSEIVRLKWPNDLVVDGAKAAGILIESGRGPNGLWLAVGVGLNLATAPSEVERPATCLGAHLAAGRTTPTPKEALQRLDVHLARRLALWESQGGAAVAAAFVARAIGFGEPCAVRLDKVTLNGVAEGLEDDGALRLRLPDGALRRITAGDVFFAPAPGSGAR